MAPEILPGRQNRLLPPLSLSLSVFFLLFLSPPPSFPLSRNNKEWVKEGEGINKDRRLLGAGAVGGSGWKGFWGHRATWWGGRTDFLQGDWCPPPPPQDSWCCGGIWRGSRVGGCLLGGGGEEGLGLGSRMDPGLGLRGYVLDPPALPPHFLPTVASVSQFNTVPKAEPPQPHGAGDPHVAQNLPSSTCLVGFWGHTHTHPPPSSVPLPPLVLTSPPAALRPPSSVTPPGATPCHPRTLAGLCPTTPSTPHLGRGGPWGGGTFILGGGVSAPAGRSLPLGGLRGGGSLSLAGAFPLLPPPVGPPPGLPPPQPPALPAAQRGAMAPPDGRSGDLRQSRDPGFESRPCRHRRGAKWEKIIKNANRMEIEIMELE